MLYILGVLRLNVFTTKGGTMDIGNIRILNKKSIQRKEIEEILTEFPDISVDNVNSLIRYSSGRYIVWLDCENEFDWETTDNYDKQSTEEINTYISRIGVLQHQPISRCLSRKQYKEFNYMLAEAIVLVLENEFCEADEHIYAAEQYLKSRNCEITRKWQLEYCFIVLAVIFAIVGIVKHNSVNISNYFGVSSDAMSTIGYSILGTIGATLSIIQKSGKQCYDCESGRFLNFLEIMSRMFASVISGFVVIYLYKLDLIFANFRSDENTQYCLVLICIIAGFSERLVPSIISNFENNEIKEDCCNEQKSIDNF